MARLPKPIRYSAPGSAAWNSGLPRGAITSSMPEGASSLAISAALSALSIMRMRGGMRSLPSEFQEIVAELGMRIGPAAEAAPLQRGHQSVRHLGHGAAADIAHGEEEAVAADLLHRLGHLRRDRVR